MLELTWLLPALPLAGFLFLLVFGRKLGEPWAGWVATAAVGAAFLVACIVFVGLLGLPADERSFTQTLYTWFEAGSLKVELGFLLDPLSMTMVLFVTGVATLIHIYSVSYMHGDARFSRFFLLLNLFVASMLVLVLGDNMLVTFLGWEGVGVCSYLLISFWFDRERAAVAGKKAFVTNRVGDFGFMLAIFLVFTTIGSVNYLELNEAASTLAEVTATAIALLLFVGAAGKSAQLPLFIWLPDAMEGPTSVSALIHAATMVTAGVYLMCRVAPVLDVAPIASAVIAWIAVATALLAAAAAIAQNDIKRVLAYSTISQLGFMFLAIGVGAYSAAVFHMVTHAFFKALLFLGAGSVIHGLHGEQDMRRMGGLAKYMPWTAATFIVGWLAIIGAPPLAGFWSKDEVIVYAFGDGPLLYVLASIAALLTAYYMTRQVILVFFGKPRWAEATDGHAVEPHESDWLMVGPLVVLAVLTLFAGALNTPFSHTTEFLTVFLEPVLGEASTDYVPSTAWKLTAPLIATALALLGVLAAWWLFAKRREPADALEPEVLQHAWYLDDAVAWTVDKPGRASWNWTAWFFDRRVIDGAVNGVATLVRDTGLRLRTVQTGYVRTYALGLAAGAVVLLAWFAVRAGI